jgi:hypothetical protein
MSQQPTSPVNGHRRFSLKKLVVGSLALIVVAAAILGYVAYMQVDDLVRDSYAQWWVADMLVDYMERNSGAWPRNWEDLREPYEICAGRSGPTWSFDELQKRVGIRFDANPSELVKANSVGDQPPFHVVYLNNGRQRWWEGREPNSMILKYLVERAARPATYKYPKRPDPEEKQSRAGLTEELGAQWELDGDGHVVIVKLASPQGNSLYADPAMVHLKALKELRELNLGYSQITDAGLAAIADSTELRSLYLYGTKVTDDGLRHLHRLNKLETLVLASENFSDAGLEHVASLPSLKLLNLNGTRVTDAGLPHLFGLKNLTEVMVGNTKVTSIGAKRLQQALPNTRIYPFSSSEAGNTEKKE